MLVVPHIGSNAHHTETTYFVDMTRDHETADQLHQKEQTEGKLEAPG